VNSETLPACPAHGVRFVVPLDPEDRDAPEPTVQGLLELARGLVDALERMVNLAHKGEPGSPAVLLLPPADIIHQPPPARRGETSQSYTVALGEHEATYTATSALSAVLGDGAPDLALAPGQADLPPAPVDTRPWMPTGDLVVVVARGELRQTIRLDCAPSYRIGAHKDAEIRLLGAHTIAATLLQQDGAVWVCRGADNVAVDLLGLDIRETVRLRERAEVQIGSMYTLTITSAAELSRST
jgi:hypothetical protein